MKDVAMRNLNLDPFWRTSVGFDRLFDLMDESLRFEPEDNYPPCNIVRTGEDKYRISLAVAGFKPEQISVTVHGNTLSIAGRINEKQDGTEYLHRGIAGRPFERRFNLADFVEVKLASFEDGLLQIELALARSTRPRRSNTVRLHKRRSIVRSTEMVRAQYGLEPSSSGILCWLA
jgi:molecular chaperone IbpA